MVFICEGKVVVGNMKGLGIGGIPYNSCLDTFIIATEGRLDFSSAHSVTAHVYDILSSRQDMSFQHVSPAAGVLMSYHKM